MLLERPDTRYPVLDGNSPGRLTNMVEALGPGQSCQKLQLLWVLVEPVQSKSEILSETAITLGLGRTSSDQSCQKVQFRI